MRQKIDKDNFLLRIHPLKCLLVRCAHKRIQNKQVGLKTDIMVMLAVWHLLMKGTIITHPCTLASWACIHLGYRDILPSLTTLQYQLPVGSGLVLEMAPSLCVHPQEISILGSLILGRQQSRHGQEV
jgi:hypothetical protein